MSRLATRTSDFEAKAVLCALLIWLGFLVFHPIIRLAFDIELGPADSLELIAGQELKLNYRTRQPPLYTWFISISGQVFGPGALASQIVKYGFMAIAGIGFYLAGLSATNDRKKAALGSLAALMIFNVGFTIHDQSTHSVALIAAIALLCAGYMALCRSETPFACVIIGVAGAIAVLSKHSGWILVLAFPFALFPIEETPTAYSELEVGLCGRSNADRGTTTHLFLADQPRRSDPAPRFSGRRFGWRAPVMAPVARTSTSRWRRRRTFPAACGASSCLFWIARVCSRGSEATIRVCWSR